MPGKYFVELKDKFHIFTAEKIVRTDLKSDVKLLKPRDDDTFSLENESYNDFWLWLKDEKSFLPGDTLDICFICPDEMSVKPLIECISCIGVNLSEDTEITLGDAKAFLQKTGRNLEDAKLSNDKTILYLSEGSKLLAFNAKRKGLKTNPEKTDEKQPQDLQLSKPAKRKSVRQRPKAFRTMPMPAEENTPSPIAPPKDKKEQAPLQGLAPRPPYSNNAIPKATATDIQIGIKRITEDQCQDVDFRD